MKPAETSNCIYRNSSSELIKNYLIEEFDKIWYLTYSGDPSTHKQNCKHGFTLKVFQRKNLLGLMKK